MKIITVGRSSENDIVINDSYASRSHCEFIQDDSGNYWISDLNSRNGTFVNGHAIRGKVSINSADIVRIGNTTLPWLEYFSKQENIIPVDDNKPLIDNKPWVNSKPLVDIPSDININKKEEYISADMRKRGDDFSVGFLRKMGDNIGNLLGNTIGCILSIILIIAFIAIIVAIAS